VRFKQIFLLATRREKDNVPANEEIDAIQALSQTDLPPVGFAPEPCLVAAARSRERDQVRAE
jgi:hypothetical protein